MVRVTPFLMFDGRLEEALRFYQETFPGTKVRTQATGGDGPRVAAELELGGQTFMAYDGGPYFAFSEAFSLFLDCADQAEVDRHWDAIVAAGGKPSQCGWITDPFGLSWQVVPRRFMELIGDPDPVRVQAVAAAMMTMGKLDVAALESAHANAGTET